MEKNTIAVIMAIITALVVAIRIYRHGQNIDGKIPVGFMVFAAIPAACVGWVITNIVFLIIESF